MPTYQVEDARGRVLELDGDHEPSQEEAAQAFTSAFLASEDMQSFRDAPDATATETSPLSERGALITPPSGGALIAPTNEQIAPLPTQVAPLTAGEVEGTRCSARTDCHDEPIAGSSARGYETCN